MAEAIPQTYADWRYCITVECGIPLEAAYVDSRIVILKSTDNEETRRFRKIYGDSHWQHVLAWFQQARDDLRYS